MDPLILTWATGDKGEIPHSPKGGVWQMLSQFVNLPCIGS